MSTRNTNTKHSSILGASVLALVVSACAGSNQPPPAPPPAPLATASATPTAAPSAAPAATPAPAPTTAPTAAAPAEPPHGAHHHPHPMMGMILSGLGELSLKPEQKAVVDGIKADFEKMPESMKDARAQFVKDLADGAAAGKLDKAKLAADQKKLTQAADSSSAKVQEDANKLHKTLDADQRKKLVELVRAKGKEMDEHMKAEWADHEKAAHGPAGKPGEHGHHMDKPAEKGQPAGAGEHEHGEHGHMGPHPMMGNPGMMMDKLAEELGLTADQKEKLKAKLEGTVKADMGKMKEHHGNMQKRMKTIADAFESEKFDAKKAGVGEHADEMVKAMTDMQIRFVEAVLSVITAEQRAKLADHLRMHGEDQS